jgi:adenosylcobinamide kinase/adenosylcobinamide-phosphate guanylyltransferase
VIYVATAHIDPTDSEWQARIVQHQERRPPNWSTQHVPHDLAGAIAQGNDTHCLLVDSLGTWLANHLEMDDLAWEQTVQDLLAALAHTPSQVIFVAEETGWGVVPAYPLGRTFRDRLGQLTRTLAAIAQPAYLVVAGYALNLQQLGLVVPTPEPERHPSS